VREVLVGLRPEHVTASSAAIWRAPVVFAGTVEIAETIGSEVVVHARIGAERIVARFATRTAPRLGEPVTLAADGEALHLFDAATGLRLAGA
jgi:multiple sugar transport system ATP-binding protein